MFILSGNAIRPRSFRCTEDVMLLASSAVDKGDDTFFFCSGAGTGICPVTAGIRHLPERVTSLLSLPCLLPQPSPLVLITFPSHDVVIWYNNRHVSQFIMNLVIC